MKIFIFLFCLVTNPPDDHRYLLINDILYRIPVGEIARIKEDYKIQDKDIKIFRFADDSCYSSSVEYIRIATIDERLNNPFRIYMVKSTPYYILDDSFIDIDYVYPEDIRSIQIIPKEEAIAKYGCKGLDPLFKILLLPGKKIQSKKVGGIKISQNLPENVPPENDSFTIIGKTKGFRDSTRLYLRKAESGSLLDNQDSAFIINNSFVFRGKVSEPTRYEIHTGYTGWTGQPPDNFYYVSFYAENSTIFLDDEIGNLKFAKFSGSELQDDFNELNFKRYPVAAKLDSINKSLRNLNPADSARRIILQKEARRQVEEYEQVFIEFIKTHPKSILSAEFLNGYKTSWGRIKTRELYGMLDLNTQNTHNGKSIREFIDVAEVKNSIKFIDLNLPDLNGASVKLSDLSGKYILLEFWASWCGPCRAENPGLAKLYKKYKSRGFEIYAVNLDDKKQSWQQTVKEDSISWITVSDLKGPANSKAAMLYEVSGIPRNFLIDRNGNIIAKDLRGEDLAVKLREVFESE